MNGAEVALAALGIMATIVGVLVWLLKKLFTQNETTLQEANKANFLLSKSIDRLAVASEEQIRASRAREERDRKFQELVITKLDGLDEKADRNHDAIIAKQTVKVQTVEHQTVKTEIHKEK